MKFEERRSVNFFCEGKKIFGTYHLPVQASGRAVLICHGFGGHKAGKYRIYVLLSELLSKAGIASLRFDCRGCGDSEGDLIETTISTMVEDAREGMGFLQGEHETVGLLGRSLGGAVATLLAEETGEVASMAMWSPFYSGEQWQELYERATTVDLNEEQKKELMSINGQIGGEPFYHELFALNLQKKVENLSDVPMFFVHSVKDPLVHIQHTDSYLQCRRGAAARTEFFPLEHSDHDFSHFDEREASILETVNWFKETL